MREAGPKCRRAPLARELGVSERTLLNWESGAGKAMNPLGRPAASPQKRFRASLKVARQMRRQGLGAGWRPILKTLGPEVPTRLVQESVSRLKKRHRLKFCRKMSASRVKVQVLSPDVIWVQDATHVGRLQGKAVQAEVIKDRGTLEYVEVAVGRPADAQEVLWMLEKKRQEGGLPLVWATDNGSVYRDERVTEYLRREKVVHLLSRTHTPQDNAAAEKGIRELKAEAGLGKGVNLSGLEDAFEKLAYSKWILDTQRLRGSKGYRTAKQLKGLLPSWDSVVQREAFYAQACQRMEKAVEGGGTARRKRQAERQAVYETLEEFGLVERTRGGKPLKLEPKESEDIL